ncbi:MAG: hypothetical protein R3212_13415, partial [Xanthomonadales bacterium]|nr:hypothetical protein [Xanthomonadales bacterium]
ELGERYERLAGRIIAFDADVIRVDATFKLAQDEETEVLEDILAGVSSDALRHWMERFNAGRS